jgi:hypothetical protein
MTSYKITPTYIFLLLCLWLTIFFRSGREADAVGAITRFTTLEAETGILGCGATIHVFTPGSAVTSGPTKELEASGMASVWLTNLNDSVLWMILICASFFQLRVRSRRCGVIFGILFMLAGISVSNSHASVPASDVTLEPVVMDNLPAFGYITAYGATESTVQGAAPANESPLYYPYDSVSTVNGTVVETSTNDAWWDNLVAEQLQARLPVVMLTAGGTWTTNQSDLGGPGMNPRDLQNWWNAVNRAGATNLFKTACFAEAFAQPIYQNYYHLPSTALCDFANTDSWNQVWWLRIIKPWFDTVPSNTWYYINGGVPIEFWGLNSSSFYTNNQGNVSKMFNFLATNLQANYGITPRFILGSINSADTNLVNNPYMVADNEWFSPPSRPYNMTPYKGYTWGGLVAGYIDPNYFNPSSSDYGNLNRVLIRTGISSQGVSGANGDTLIDGLNAAVNSNARFSVIEGYTDVAESCGPFRSLSTNWDYPNQYLSILCSYIDLRTTTLRLEAEGCDEYANATGNPGSVYRRTGTLGIRALPGSGWAVTGTVAGEWIQFTNLQFSAGNYKFSVCYSSTASHTLRLYIDGVALPDVVVPSTGGTNLFDTAYLGTNAMSHGLHTLRLFFVDGGEDVDWIFVKKFDPAVTFQSVLSGFYLGAQFGGNDSLVCNWTSPDNWERFTVDDLEGNGTLFSGDTVNIQAYNGLYLTATNGGGSTLAARQRVPSGSENFSIVQLNGSGALTNGDQVAIQTSGGNYVTVESDGSADASGTSIGTAQTFIIQTTPGAAPVSPIPSAPTGVIGVVTGNQINLSWNPTPGTTSYNVKRSTDFGGPYTTIAANVVNSTNYLDMQLPNSTTFYYVVSAVNGGGESLNSSVASVTIPAPPTLLSQNQPATGSSNQTGYPPSYGDDGNLGTRWSANGPIYPSWWRVDLGTNCNLSSVTVDWYGVPGRYYQYTIDVSTNDVNYVTVVNQTGNTLKANTTDYFTATARYVRITVTGGSQAGGNPSFYECQVYGSVVPSVSLAPTSIAMVASGSTISLSWPSDHLGWSLQVQTNAPNAGLGTNWVTVPGSDLVTSTNITMDPGNGAVFFRLVYP